MPCVRWCKYGTRLAVCAAVLLRFGATNTAVLQAAQGNPTCDDVPLPQPLPYNPDPGLYATGPRKPLASFILFSKLWLCADYHHRLWLLDLPFRLPLLHN